MIRHLTKRAGKILLLSIGLSSLAASQASAVSSSANSAKLDPMSDLQQQLLVQQQQQSLLRFQLSAYQTNSSNGALTSSKAGVAAANSASLQPLVGKVAVNPELVNPVVVSAASFAAFEQYNSAATIQIIMAANTFPVPPVATPFYQTVSNEVTEYNSQANNTDRACISDCPADPRPKPSNN